MHDISAWRHPHIFDHGNPDGERVARRVAWITLVMMVAEIAGGLLFNSMALFADGWHMGTHAAAIGLSAFAYAMARRFSTDTRFAFGTWKIEVLASFSSALILGVVALAMLWESFDHLWKPQAIHYQEAMLLAVLGLLVNLVCAWILGGASHHHHDHAHPHDHPYPHKASDDLNLKSAYVHLIADIATSVLAIVALAGGMWLGWAWLDPVMGLVGAIMIAHWSVCLARDAGRVLLDFEMDNPMVEEIRSAIEAHPQWGSTRIADLHVWRVGKENFAVIVGLVTHDAALNAERVRRELSKHIELVHVSVEINYCGCEQQEARTS